MSKQFIVTSTRSPDLDDTEVRKRLGRAYAIILGYTAKKEIADRDSLASTTRTATSGAPAAEPKGQ